MLPVIVYEAVVAVGMGLSLLMGSMGISNLNHYLHTQSVHYEGSVNHKGQTYFYTVEGEVEEPPVKREERDITEKKDINEKKQERKREEKDVRENKRENKREKREYKERKELIKEDVPKGTIKVKARKKANGEVVMEWELDSESGISPEAKEDLLKSIVTDYINATPKPVRPRGSIRSFFQGFLSYVNEKPLVRNPFKR